MVVPSDILARAIEIYLREAYPSGPPAPVRAKAEGLKAPAGEVNVPIERLEKDASAAGSAGGGVYVIRLGQPMYPHMKLVLDAVPAGQACAGQDFLFRVDAHDRHLHAKPGSPDEAWLQKIREGNQALGEKIEAAWAAAGLPTFKEFLRGQLEARKRAKA